MGYGNGTVYSRVYLVSLLVLFLMVMALAPPTDALQHFASQFKGYKSRILRQEFPHLRRRMPCLWSRSYYVGSAGHVSAEVIQKYIEAQKEKP